MKNGKNANIFLGIPYAAAPIEDLRLEDTSEPSPVAVWIHGGGFCFGDSEIYGYKQLAENFVSRGIIVVTIQYRLGPFGFFSLGDHNLPGNFGLWDQRQALLFLREVLPAFGGDKERITVWGHSAGGTSASLLSASPHTRDLFSQTFQMSGSTFVEWGNSKRVIGVSQQLSEYLGCPKTSCSKTIKDCIKTKTTQEILEASDKLGLSRNDLNFDWYHPVADVEWFGKDYIHELQDSPKKPTLIGVTSAESLLCSAYVPESLATMFSMHMGIKKDDQPNFSKQNLINFIRNKIATISAFGNDAEAAFKDLKEFYVERGSVDQKSQDRFYFNRYTDLLSDIQFTIPSIRDGLEKSKLDWPTYIYLFDYTNPELVEEFGFYGGANHGLELAYLHGTFIFKYFNFTPIDYNLRNAYVEGVANFFKYGKPSFQNQEWPKMIADDTFKYFHLGEKTQIADNFFNERLEFWENFGEKYHFDLIRGEYRHSKKVKDEL
uniref:Carboxylic ester hydrolase n=1 Tax=Panagrolaimus sp. ES5 TaxID=591445 RepID=A0AC34FSH6_9BILA